MQIFQGTQPKNTKKTKIRAKITSFNNNIRALFIIYKSLILTEIFSKFWCWLCVIISYKYADTERRTYKRNVE